MQLTRVFNRCTCYAHRFSPDEKEKMLNDDDNYSLCLTLMVKGFLSVFFVLSNLNLLLVC